MSAASRIVCSRSVIILDLLDATWAKSPAAERAPLFYTRPLPRGKEFPPNVAPIGDPSV